MNRKEHWEGVYAKKRPDEMSWYQGEPTLSLRLIDEAAGAGDGPVSIIDVGAGASVLVDRLLDRPRLAVTVLDVSGAALRTSQARLGGRAGKVRWIESDILTADLPASTYDVWHDRAVFHFLTDADDRRGYLDQVERAVKPGGHVLIVTFASDGPLKCSGLDVVRYAPEELHAQFGPSFRLVRTLHEDHATPMGTTQKFVYCILQRI